MGWAGLRWPAEGPVAPVGVAGSATGPSGRGDRPGGERLVLPAGVAWWAVPGAVVGIVLAGLGASIGYGLTHSKTSAASDLLGEAGLWAAMLGTALFVSRRYGSASLARDYRLAIKARDLLWGLVALVCALVVVQVVLAVFAGTKFAGSNDEIITQQKGHELGLVVVAFLQRFLAHGLATSVRPPWLGMVASDVLRARPLR